MSLVRSVYYGTVIGGIAAFIGWLVSEVLFLEPLRDASIGFFGVASIGGIVGAAIGVAVSVVAGMANAQWRQLLLRALPGLIGGGIGGAVGGLLGNALFVLFGLPRVLGWLIMGLGIGVADGVYERSKSKVRNGLIGGALGGGLGGVLFDSIPSIVENSLGLSSSTGMSSRAAGFVILGLCIGALIGLAQVVLKEAWLTVLDGYRTGRQLILSQEVTVLGRGDHLPLPFLGPMNKDLESEHLKIIRQPSGSFILEDNDSRRGTLLNGQRIEGPAALKDGDIIRIGTNLVRFNERVRKSAGQEPVVRDPFQGKVASAPPPQAPRKASAGPPSRGAASARPVEGTSTAAPTGERDPPRKTPSPGKARPGTPLPPPPPPRRKS